MFKIWLIALALAGCLQARPNESDVVLDIQDCGNTPQVSCYPDNDGDGQGAGGGGLFCSCPAGMVANNLDCNDNNANVKRRDCYPDADGDGHGAAGSSPTSVCAVSCGQGMSDDNIDWVDDDPGATLRTCYDDLDGDGHFGTLIHIRATTCDGFCDFNNDIDDTDPSIYQTLKCYPDADGDHYGHGTSYTSMACGATCPPGYSESAGDCDDTNSNIHPYRLEVAGNGIDDDCSGAIDEARSVFYETGNGNTDTSFAITVTLNNSAEISAATGAGLKAQISYRKLADADGTDPPNYTITGMKTMTISTAGGVTTATVTLTGVDSLTVYEAQLSLFTSTGTRIQPADGKPYNSDPYYTMTKPSGTDTPVKTARYNIVVEALYQYYYFRTHAMGPWNDSLRNHFALDRDGDEWCTEFYAVSAKPFLSGMDPTDESSTPAMESYFAGYETAVTDAKESDLAASKPGDWLGVNPNDIYIYGRHTQMLLAYNASAHVYWFVEGNGNDDETFGKNQHTVDVGSHTVDWVQTIGRLDNPAMIDP